jgi:cytochrome c-type biogenesis protein CcmH
MKTLKLFLVIFILLNFSESKSDEEFDKVKNKILKNVRCLICQGQSVYDSESEFASSIKLVVSNKINDGLSEEQIYEFLKEKYGQWILYDPEMSKNTYILWLLPMLLFLFGGAIIYKNLIIKKR